MDETPWEAMKEWTPRYTFNPDEVRWWWGYALFLAEVYQLTEPDGEA